MSGINAGDSCSTCVYYNNPYPGYEEPTGSCLRYPPKFLNDGRMQAYFPIVRRDMVCGEHKLASRY